MVEILKNVSHDSINRFLQRERYVPKDLFDFITTHNWIEPIRGVISSDDTVIEKSYSDPKTTDWVGYYWSSKHGYECISKGLEKSRYFASDSKTALVAITCCTPPTRKC